MPFSPAYDRLNPEQKLAVDTVEGPVMVIAGPGTGKTQVLAVRVANILKKTQVKPSNILCLTFSNAGAVAMRERLRTLIGPDAYGVTIDTVHGFCDRLIRRAPLAFSEWADLSPLSDIDRVRMMERLIDQVSHTSALVHPKNPYDRVGDILSRISDCKREGKTMADLKKVAEIYDAEMSEKSRAGTKADQKNRLQARKFRDFIDLFKRYEEERTAEGRYDYDDMILTVLAVLREDSELLASLHERYQYVLIDEAQDLNGAQWDVITMLTTFESVSHEPNVFVVGDDDQAIYRFQGANTAHMLAFRARFPEAPVIMLVRNYRSTQHILDAAGRLIARSEGRLVGAIEGLSKDLVATTKEKGSEPLLLRPPSDTAEPWMLADYIDARLKQGIAPEEIAVLVQTNRELKPIYDVLRTREIPVVLFGKADLMTHPLTMQIVTMLRFVFSEQDSRLFHALGCAVFHCHPADLGRLQALARSEKVRAMDLLLKLPNGNDVFLHPDRLIAARDILLHLRKEAESRTVLETVEYLIRVTGMVTDSLDPLDIATVDAFFTFVRSRSLATPGLHLSQFLSELEFYASEDYPQVRLTYQLPHLVTSGVQLMTAHQSKGLEFHTVFLLGFREGHWDERTAHSGLSVPEELLFGWQPETKRAEKHQDERRVAYVAMTRAKRELYFVCPREFSVGERIRSVSPSAFFAEAGPLPEENVELLKPEESSLLLHNVVRDLDAEFSAYITEKLRDFALSPSALTAFLRSPKEFLYHHLLGLPEEITPASLRALGYGNAVHWALKKWAEARRKGESLTDAELLKECQWYLEERTILSETERRDLLSEAVLSLPRFIEARLRDTTTFLHAVEQDFRVTLGDIHLRGKIDRIDRLTDTSSIAIVYDYKTGRPKAPGAIRGGLEAGTVSWSESGEYFRQLAFYAVLLEHAEPLLQPQSFVLEFVGERDEEPITREFQILPEEKNDLLKLIRAVWDKIQAQDFSPLDRSASL
ncbi:MAG: ATP-dependent DNA helicase [Candidatus Peribacteraceae bacterium]